MFNPCNQQATNCCPGHLLPLPPPTRPHGRNNHEICAAQKEARFCLHEKTTPPLPLPSILPSSDSSTRGAILATGANTRWFRRSNFPTARQRPCQGGRSHNLPSLSLSVCLSHPPACLCTDRGTIVGLTDMDCGCGAVTHGYTPKHFFPSPLPTAHKQNSSCLSVQPYPTPSPWERHRRNVAMPNIKHGRQPCFLVPLHTSKNKRSEKNKGEITQEKRQKYNDTTTHTARTRFPTLFLRRWSAELDQTPSYT